MGDIARASTRLVTTARKAATSELNNEGEPAWLDDAWRTILSGYEIVAAATGFPASGPLDVARAFGGDDPTATQMALEFLGLEGEDVTGERGAVYQAFIEGDDAAIYRAVERLVEKGGEVTETDLVQIITQRFERGLSMFAPGGKHAGAELPPELRDLIDTQLEIRAQLIAQARRFARSNPDLVSPRPGRAVTVLHLAGGRDGR